MKRFILFLVFFSFGFLTHAFFFPDFLANGISDVQQIAIPNAGPTKAIDSNLKFETKITYDGEHFNRHTVTIGVGSYLLITNTTKENKLMWLLSNNPELATPRGYGESEQIRTRLETRGQYVVVDKNNPQERLIITVK
jgi:hypothetical protein